MYHISSWLLFGLLFPLQKFRMYPSAFKQQHVLEIGSKELAIKELTSDSGVMCYNTPIHLGTWSFPEVSASTDRVALWGPHGKAFFPHIPVITRGPWRPVAKTDRTLWRFQTSDPGFWSLRPLSQSSAVQLTELFGAFLSLTQPLAAAVTCHSQGVVFRLLFMEYHSRKITETTAGMYLSWITLQRESWIPYIETESK